MMGFIPDGLHAGACLLYEAILLHICVLNDLADVEPCPTPAQELSSQADQKAYYPEEVEDGTGNEESESQTG